MSSIFPRHLCSRHLCSPSPPPFLSPLFCSTGWRSQSGRSAGRTTSLRRTTGRMMGATVMMLRCDCPSAGHGGARCRLPFPPEALPVQPARAWQHDPVNVLLPGQPLAERPEGTQTLMNICVAVCSNRGHSSKRRQTSLPSDESSKRAEAALVRTCSFATFTGAPSQSRHHRAALASFAAACCGIIGAGSGELERCVPQGWGLHMLNMRMHACIPPTH